MVVILTSQTLRVQIPDPPLPKYIATSEELYSSKPQFFYLTNGENSCALLMRLCYKLNDKICGKYLVYSEHSTTISCHC